MWLFVFLKFHSFSNGYFRSSPRFEGIRTPGLLVRRLSQSKIGVISAPICAFYRHSFGEFSIVSVQSCPIFSCSGSKLGQDLLTGGFQCGNIMQQRVPHGGNIDRSVSVDIEVPGVLNDTPWNCLIPHLDIVRKLRNQLADLNNAHTAGILKEIVLLKSGKVMMVAL